MVFARQVAVFCMVGVVTTLVDFGVFNLLAGRRLRWKRIPANLVSVMIAMSWSFVANWILVFQPDGNEWLVRAGRFLITTAFSAFVLQNLILYLTTYLWKWPANLALAIARKIPFVARINEDVISRNFCKSMAVSAGLIWNFCFYKFFVYAN